MSNAFVENLERSLAEADMRRALAPPHRPAGPRLAYAVGLDLGQSTDHTALCVVETEERAAGETRRHRLRHLHRFPLKTGYPMIVDATCALLRRPPLASGDTTLVVDATGVGAPVVDLLIQAELRAAIVPVTITAGSTVTAGERGGYHVPKRDLVSSLQVLLQSGELQIADGLPLGETLKTELAGFRVKISLTGRDSYGAGEDWRSAPHDDLVLSVALACWYASRSHVDVAIV